MELDKPLMLSDDILNGIPEDPDLYITTQLAQQILKHDSLTLEQVFNIKHELDKILNHRCINADEFTNDEIYTEYDLFLRLLLNKHKPLLEFLEKYDVTQIYAVLILSLALTPICKSHIENLQMLITKSAYKAGFELLTIITSNPIKSYQEYIEQKRSEIEKEARRKTSSEGGNKTKQKRQAVIKLVADIYNAQGPFPSIKNAAENIFEVVIEKDRMTGGRLYKNSDQCRSVARILSRAKEQGLLNL